MGMYTEIYVNVDLKKDLPSEVVRTLKAMCGEEGYSSSLEGKPSRWAYLFRNGSFYTPNTSTANLTYDHISKNYSLLAKGDIKNYQEEIEEFFEWIMPHIDASEGSFIGYSRYEEDDVPELYFKRGE